MAALQALRTAVRVLRQNPVLFVPSLLLVLLTLPQTVAGLLGIPFLQPALQGVTFFVAPFFVAGLVGMADEALSGRANLGTLVETGKRRYVALLVGNLVQVAVFLVGGIAVFAAVVVGLFAVGVGSLSVGAGGIDTPAVGVALGGLGLVLALVVLVVFLALVVFGFFVQFYTVAIAAADESPLDGYRTSIRLVRDNLLATLGFWVVNLVTSLFVVAPFVALFVDRLLAMDPSDVNGVGGASFSPFAGLSAVDVGGFAVAVLVLGTLLTAFQQTFAVAFFRRHESPKSDGDDSVTALGADDVDRANWS